MPRLLVVLASTVCALLALASSAHAVVIDFDDLPSGTELGNQYSAKGVTFKTSIPTGSAGVTPVVFPPSSGTQNTPPNVAGEGTCQGEICTHLRFTGKFSTPHKTVSLYIGNYNHGGKIRVRMFSDKIVNGKREVVGLTNVTVPGGADVTKKVLFIRPGYDIRYFEIDDLTDGGAGSRNGLLFDTLEFDAGDPNQQPDFTLSSANLNADGSYAVREGTTREVTIDVDRFGGAAGALNFTVTDATGITEEIGASSSASSVTLKLTAPPGNPPFNGPFTVTATPASPGAGQAPRILTFQLNTIPAFALDSVGTTVSPCGQGSAVISVYTPDPLLVPQASVGQIGLDAEVDDATTTVKLTPASVAAPSTEDVKVKASIDISPDAIGKQPITIVARRFPYNDYRLTLPVNVSPGGLKVTSLTSSLGYTPRQLGPGSLLTIKGNGLCDGLDVLFGNSFAKGKIVEVKPDGTSMTVRVPYLATSGKVVVAAGTTAAASPKPLKILSYRNTNGYQFRNYDLDDLEWAHTVELYGEQQTHLSACIPFTDACWVSPISDPTALAYHATMDGWLSGDPGDAHCFGMSLTSQRFLDGHRSINEPFFNPLAESIWDIAVEKKGFTDEALGPANPVLDSYLKANHIAQLSVEGMDRFAEEFVENDLFGTPKLLREQVEGLLNKGDYPIVSIQDGGGHAMIIYDLEPTDLPGKYYLRVYDSNQPWTKASGMYPKFGAKAFTGVGKAHKDGEEGSRILVSGALNGGSGGWEFPNLGWSGGMGSIAVIDVDDIPVQPTIPSLGGLLDYVSLGSGTEAVGVTDENGDMTKGIGTTPPRARRLYVQDSGAPPGNAWAVRRGTPYVFELRGKAEGSYSSGIVSRGITARFEDVPTDGKTTDTLVFDSAHGAVGFATQAERKPMTVVLASSSLGAKARAAASGRQVRTASVQTVATPGAPSSLAIENGRVVYRHQGEPTAVRLKVGWVGPRGTPGTFVAPPLDVAAGDKLTLTPKRWAALAGSAARLAVDSAAGADTTRLLSNQAAGISALRGLSLGTSFVKGKPRFRLRGRLGKLPEGATVSGGVELTRSGKTVRRIAFSDLVPGRGPSTLMKRVAKKLPSGRYRATSVAIVVSGGAFPRTQRIKEISTVRVP